MCGGLLARAALVVLLSPFVVSSLAGAQAASGEAWRVAASSPPCVLDKCLNGGSGGPKPAPAPQLPPAAEPPGTGPPQPMGGAIAPGAFDFYLLTLSWSPGFCDAGGASKAADQCSVGARLGFVVHGLWPQNAHGYPQDCDGGSRPVSRAALALTHGVFPDEGLARYEWRKHGACTGLSPEAFFASVKRARDSIVIPDAFKAPREEQDFSPIEIARAFAAANPGLRPNAMAVTCARGELEDVRICLAKDLRAFVNCPEVARRTCRASSVAVAPVH
jgi:ribonuclease T2